MASTPGPWALMPQTFSPQIWVLREKPSADEPAIASVRRRDDARLIAAAPDLLKTLNQIRSMVSTQDGYARSPRKADAEQLCIDIIALATLAISKAQAGSCAMKGG